MRRLHLWPQVTLTAAVHSSCVYVINEAPDVTDDVERTLLLLCVGDVVSLHCVLQSSLSQVCCRLVRKSEH